MRSDHRGINQANNPLRADHHPAALDRMCGWTAHSKPSEHTAHSKRRSTTMCLLFRDETPRRESAAWRAEGADRERRCSAAHGQPVALVLSTGNSVRAEALRCALARRAAVCGPSLVAAGRATCGRRMTALIAGRSRANQTNANTQKAQLGAGELHKALSRKNLLGIAPKQNKLGKHQGTGSLPKTVRCGLFSQIQDG